MMQKLGVELYGPKIKKQMKLKLRILKLITKDELLKKYKLRAHELNQNEVGTYLELDASKSRLDGLSTSRELQDC
jgi:hypothetical protein